jgi:hypothetical protein
MLIKHFKREYAIKKANAILNKYQHLDKYRKAGDKQLWGGTTLNRDERRIVRLEKRLNKIINKI